MNRDEIVGWLKEQDPDRLAALFARADEVRRVHVGDEIHLRGLLEISSYCVRSCAYCGISAKNRGARRYRMTAAEIIECAGRAVEYGYGTIVMQGGEDYGIAADWMADVISTIKSEYGLAVTLSLGERPRADLELWRRAGADRYLLRFETSDPALYELIHPALPGGFHDRISQIRLLQEIGFEAGSGVMIGIPGQSWESLANDILTFADLDLDMIGVGPYIPHPETPMGAYIAGNGSCREAGRSYPSLAPGIQVPATAETAFKVVALTRIVCPDANIPSTTAIATLNREAGRRQGLMCGANIVMPNLTPARYRECYEIYPDKATLVETAGACARDLKSAFESMGRRMGSGAGGRRRRASSEHGPDGIQ